MAELLKKLSKEEVHDIIAQLQGLETDVNGVKPGIRKGELCQKLKDGVDHGEFTSLLNEQLGIPERTAQQYMSVARLKKDRLKVGKPASFAGLGLTSLFELARPNVPAELIDQIIDEAAITPLPYKSVSDRVNEAVRASATKGKAQKAKGKAKGKANAAKPVEAQSAKIIPITGNASKQPREPVSEPEPAIPAVAHQTLTQDDVATGILREMIPPIIERLKAEVPEFMADIIPMKDRKKFEKTATEAGKVVAYLIYDLDKFSEHTSDD